MLDGTWSISGAHDPNRAARSDERGIATVVVMKTKEGRKIAARREQPSATDIQG